jgi:hypothetical protein
VLKKSVLGRLMVSDWAQSAPEWAFLRQTENQNWGRRSFSTSRPISGSSEDGTRYFCVSSPHA